MIALERFFRGIYPSAIFILAVIAVQWTPSTIASGPDTKRFAYYDEDPNHIRNLNVLKCEKDVQKFLLQKTVCEEERNPYGKRK